MTIRYLDKQYAVGPQLVPADVARLKAQGFATLFCHRPDGESADQPAFAEIAAEARKHGMEAVHLPVVPGQISPADRDAFAALYAGASKPVFGYCRTGTRAETLWADTRDRRPDDTATAGAAKE